MPDTDVPNALAVARAAARAAAEGVVKARAVLEGLEDQEGPAKATLAAAEQAVAHVSSLRKRDAERRADFLASGRQPKPDATIARALANAESEAAEAERQAEAGRVLLGRLAAPARIARERLMEAEMAQHGAAKALVTAEHAEALVAWDQAVEVLGRQMAQLEAIDVAAGRLGHALGDPGASVLRRVLKSEGLVLSSWGIAGRKKPAWLEPNADQAGIGADAILAEAGLPHGWRAPPSPVMPRVGGGNEPRVNVTHSSEDARARPEAAFEVRPIDRGGEAATTHR